MIKDLLQKAFILKNKGHYKHAIEILYKVLEEDNTSVELLLEIGDLFYKLGNEEKTIYYIEQILNKYPDHIPTLKLLEKIFLNKNALEEAEQTAKNIYCFSNNINDLGDILKILNKENKFDEIFEYKINKKNDTIRYEIANAYYNKQDYLNAEKELEEISNPNDKVLILLCKTLYKAKKKDKCIELFYKIEDTSNFPELLNIQGLIAKYQGDFNKARNLLSKAITLDSKNDEYYYNLANVFFNQNDLISAKRYYNIAITLQPKNRKYHFTLAKLYYSEKKYKRALEEIQEDFFEGNLLKAIILYDTGYLALAEKEFKNLLKQAPENNIINEYLSKIKLNLGFN